MHAAATTGVNSINLQVHHAVLLLLLQALGQLQLLLTMARLASASGGYFGEKCFMGLPASACSSKVPYDIAFQIDVSSVLVG
jgi:hypothetical protein